MIIQFRQYRNWCISITLCIGVLAGSAAFADQIQTVTLSSATPEAQQKLTLTAPVISSSSLTQTPSETQNKQQKEKTAAPPITSSPSLMEQYVSGVIETTDLDDAFKGIGVKNPNAATSGITQFGYSLFEQSSSPFFISGNVPVGPDYVIGPGDEIRLAVWGNVEETWNVVVDRDGRITLPKIGILGVTGLSFKQLKELLSKELSQYYSGFEMDVSLGALRTIHVYIVGNAKRPGAYTISSLSTLVNALFETGGPSKTGTMRDIQVKRNKETIIHFDMYDFLLKGDKTNDIRLMPEDIIFIAPAGGQVSIAGGVKNPAIYEIKGDMSALDLIDMAGGFNDIAFSGRLQLERIVEKTRRTVFETDASHAGEIKLQGGDIVNVFPIVEDRKTVRVSGAVKRVGEYGFSSGMTVKDLITLSGGLLYYAFGEEAEITRVKITDEGPITEKIPFKLKDALQGKADSNIALLENDYLFIRTIPEWRLYRTVSITGEIKFPGVYTIEKGEPLSSLLRRAGGFTKNAYLKGAIFTRESARLRQQKTIDEMVDRLDSEIMATEISGSSAMSSDEASTQKLETEQKRRFIETLRNVKTTGRIVISLSTPDKLKGMPDDISLEEGDSINIPEDPRMVYTVGALYNQTAFTFDKSKDVSDYIDLSGGYTDNADKNKSYVFKANGSAVRLSDGFLGFSRNRISNGELESGDSIIVPENIGKIKWLKETKDITQILYQIAVTAGVLIVAF
jgi:polysaccharide biosynthesis/export protein